MKKIALILAVAAMAVSANAQRTVTTGTKWTDNTYVGVSAGAETPLTKSNLWGYDAALSGFNPNFSIMVGKYFTPVFGLRLEAEGRFNVHEKECPYGIGWGTGFFNGVNVNLLSTWNMMNLFGGYKGEPRAFEISALGGFGWGTVCENDYDAIASKVGLEFAYNFGKDKKFQVFLQPSLTYDIIQFGNGKTIYGEHFRYDAHMARLELQAGFIYKFKGTNGKHNFAIEQVRDQSEIDGLNAKINGLRSDVDRANAATAAATAKVAQLQAKVKELENKPTAAVEQKANLAPSVVFEQGKSVVRNSQMPNVEMIAKYMKNNKNSKVKISGYASPEGNAELNQKLSEKRAEAVKDVLIKKYKIAADRITTEGLGATDKLFNEVEFNRVALFNDLTK